MNENREEKILKLMKQMKIKVYQSRYTHTGYELSIGKQFIEITKDEFEFLEELLCRIQNMK